MKQDTTIIILNLHENTMNCEKSKIAENCK